MNQGKTIATTDLRQFIVDVPDFPIEGVMFRDISPLLRLRFGETLVQMAELLTSKQWDDIDALAGIEARGFIIAAGLAAMQGKGFVKVRKKGKLPGKVQSRSYGLEYGNDSLEMQAGSGRLLIVDDVLATGGTFAAAADLATACGYSVQGFMALINLTYLNQFVWQGMRVSSLIAYDAP